MKVLYIINGLGTGGAERSLSEMVPLMQDEGVTCQLVCKYRRVEGVQQSLLHRGHKIHFLRSRFLIGQVCEVRALIRRVRPDLVHTTIFEADILGRLSSIGLDIPVLTSLVNTSYDSSRLDDPQVSLWKLETARRVDGWTARHLTDHFHAITHAVKGAAVKALGIPAEKITVVERGRDPERLGRMSEQRRRKARLSLDLPENAELVLAVGRQEHQKGHKHLLEATRQLVDERPRLVVLIAGRKGNATPELMALHEHLQLGERARFLGHRDDIPELLAAADLFAFPSLYEGLGGAVLEAMALERPIVASRIPPLQEILDEGESALLVRPGDSKSLAGGIRQILDDPLQARALGGRGREIFEQRFTLIRSVSRMAELYRAIINEAAINRPVEAFA